MSIKPVNDPLPLCAVKWISVEPYDSKRKEIAIYTWDNGNMRPTYTGRIFANDKIQFLAKKMAEGQNIPIIPPETPLIVFDYYKKKYTAFLAPAKGAVLPITQKHSSFHRCAMNAALIAETLNAPILVSDKSGQVRIFQFPSITSFSSSSSTKPS